MEHPGKTIGFGRGVKEQAPAGGSIGGQIINRKRGRGGVN